MAELVSRSDFINKKSCYWLMFSGLNLNIKYRQFIRITITLERLAKCQLYARQPVHVIWFPSDARVSLSERPFATVLSAKEGPEVYLVYKLVT